MNAPRASANTPSRRIHVTRSWYRSFGKRIFDLVIAGVGLVLCAPLLLVLAVMIRFQLGSPVLFRQARPGLDGRPFLLTKLRTMTDARDANGELLPDAARLTRFGRFLRSASLDELPELWNVLRGEMSLVGPRPLLMAYLERYSEEQMRRHDVLPGITGWAQVNGRNGLTWEQKFAHDLWYVDHVSLWLDIRILMQTFVIAIRRDDINQPGAVTVREFQGKEFQGSEFQSNELEGSGHGG